MSLLVKWHNQNLKLGWTDSIAYYFYYTRKSWVISTDECFCYVQPGMDFQKQLTVVINYCKKEQLSKNHDHVHLLNIIIQVSNTKHPFNRSIHSATLASFCRSLVLIGHHNKVFSNRTKHLTGQLTSTMDMCH